MSFKDDWPIISIVAAMVGILIALVASGIHETRQWEAYRVAHKCVVVAHIDGDVFNTVGTGSNGQVVIGIGSTSDKTGWKCDDGITYYK